jgi:RNA polymerase sigma-70 factor (ECF subfamily)
MLPEAMSASDNETTSPHHTQAQFTQTHWSVVLAAANQQMPAAQDALEKLCQTYWYPLYAFLRREGHGPEDAKDLVQGFLAQLLAKGRLQSVHPAKGRFRSFLLACLTNYAHNERDKADASKRGGGHAPIPIDALTAEEHYGAEPMDIPDPAKIFERRWACILIEQVLQQLKVQCERDGKAELFETLHGYLTGEAERGGYAEAAAKLQTTEGAVRVAASRLRADFRELLYREVARTVDNPADVEAEISYLFALFGR